MRRKGFRNIKISLLKSDEMLSAIPNKGIFYSFSEQTKKNFTMKKENHPPKGLTPLEGCDETIC